MTIEELRKIAETERDAQKKFEHHVCVCIAAGCLSSGADHVCDALKREVAESGMKNEVLVKGVGCMGLCSAGPLVSATSGEGQLYAQVTAEEAPEIIRNLDTGSTGLNLCPTNVPFFERQKKIVLENSGVIDPERIEDYIAHDGYVALVTAITEMTPQSVIDQVKASGLRGRGGAGYPTGLKWSTVAKTGEQQKYVICNADEGDPGAFMDRAVLESDPHRVLEGMAIAAYAVGAQKGFIYVRAEYPLAVKHLKTAIKQAERMGLLGNSICGTRFSFHIDIRLGAGAFVCGEETALIASIEGKRGTPRPRPPFPAESGLWECPTLINNVETFANIAPIVRNGAEWFAGIGTEKSKGTKVFALAGRVENTGLIEVPMGITLREIILDIGGGIPGGKRYKAVQTGGPSGGCIPEEHLDSPVDYESLAKIGSIMGSGGMIVMDETSCMVDVARYFMEFCMSESCGKCIPCRAGTQQMHALLEKITTGEATAADVALLEELCELVRSTSLCGLGQSAPNPVITTLKYFRDEYDAHITGAGCPAGTCKKKEEVSGMSPKAPVRVKTLTIDGREVGAREDQTILEVARENGIFIPTLCNLEGLSTVGACRLCIVEVKGVNKLLPACVTRVQEGMEVTASSPRLEKFRRGILELVFAERNHVCSVCVANGHCDLQSLALKLEMTHVHFPYQYPRLPVDASHERFVVDHNRCILCTRCVRVCDEIEGAHTWDVMSRGVDCRVITDLAQPWGQSESCTGCGKCVQVCPTGALSEKGKSVSEMSKRRQFLPYLTLMREGRR